MKNSKALWESCQRYFKQNLSEEEYQRWFSGVDIETFNPSTLQLKLWVPSNYVSEYIEKNYKQLLRVALTNTFGKIHLYWHTVVAKKDNAMDTTPDSSGVRGYGPTIEGLDGSEFDPQPQPFDATQKYAAPTPGAITSPQVAGRAQSKTATAPDRGPEQQEAPVADIATQLNPRQTFRTFIEGDSNKLCRSVGYSIAEHPRSTQFNPMFIYGPSGCGKTHLVNAIGLRCKELFPDKRVLYVTARLFQVQFTNAKIQNEINNFIAFYQTIDVLIVDDVQEWASPTLKATHSTFFHIFNHLFRNAKRIILVSDRLPNQLEGMMDRLITRFSGGLVAEMEKPNTQLCYDILRRKVVRDGLTIPEDVMRYISETVNGSVREIEGVINSLMAYSVVYNSNIDMKLVERIVMRAVNINDKPLTMDEIVSAVCMRYDVTEKSLKGRSRRHNLVVPRQLIMYLADKYLRMPAIRIGRHLGGRDHSTVLYGIQQTAARLKDDKDFVSAVQDIEQTLSIKEEK